jgi:D-threo-aldose 1-dehydrogenase
MYKIKIPNTNLKVSRLIFGTASLIKNLRLKKQLYILDCAIQNGFSHFDTAPLYGFGSTEQLLGNILKKNSNITITTKVGLYPYHGINPNAYKLFYIRILQKIARKNFPNLQEPFLNFDIKKAKKSLESSLKNLQRDCIDIYMIHEPCFDKINLFEWKNFLENSIKEGKIRYYGLAGKVSSLVKFIENKQKLFNILQVQDSLENQEADYLIKKKITLQITYGYYFSSLNGKLENVNHINFFKRILTRNNTGSIIISSNNPKHIENLSTNFNLIN